jgi:predicted PurR-regulated permease PerM
VILVALPQRARIGHDERMAMLLRSLVLVGAYWALWVAVGRALPSWLTVAAAAFFWPLVDHFTGRTTSPRSLLLIPMIVGVLGSMYGRNIHRRRASLQRLAS